MLRTVTAVQQFMTEFNGAVSEDEKTVAHYKNSLKSHEAKRPPEFIGRSY
jgi:hypothetical protein